MIDCPFCVPRSFAHDPLPHFATEQKHKGWHSRMNQTREAQDSAKATYQSQRGRTARQLRALARTAPNNTDNQTNRKQEQ